MSRRSLLGFLFLNVIVTFATVFLIIKVYTSIAPQGTPKAAVPPLVMMITNTPDPRGAEKVFVVVTATLGSSTDINSGAATPEAASTGQATASVNIDNIPTLAPTASQAQVDVTQVISPGDITAEGIELRNISGGVIQMKGWTVANNSGQKFTFPDYRMFPGGRVTMYTKAGTNTPIVLYWGQSRAAWGADGEKVKVADNKREI